VARRLTREEVVHVAKLARLALGDEEIEQFRDQLSSVLDHLEALQAIDVRGVEPLAHPLGVTSRLADDRPEPTLPLATVLEMAPAAEDRYIAVPKVLDE
jgi:aspartyl-tRNA(Asn)/glutamyl-tRNA(Gln) amidotransferase subunit C